MADDDFAASGQDRLLRRDIGFLSSAFLAFNGMVGAAIFALPETLYARFGSLSPWLFPLFGGLILLIAVPFGRLAARHPASGGPVLYTARFGAFASFQVGWLYFVARTAAMAANGNVFVTYAASFWPALQAGIPRMIVIAGLCGALTVINIVGVRRAARALDALTLLKALPLIVMAIWGLVIAAEPVPAPAAPPAELGVAALLVLYAFVGFENSVVPAAETRNSERTIPRALLATLLATIALYFIVQLAYVSVMAPGAGGDAPLVRYGEVLAGPAGAILLTAAALFSLLGNVSGSLTSTPRIAYALARDGLLPGWFGKVSERYATPANAILFMGAVAAVLAISGSFVWLAVVSTLARLIVYAASLAALPAAEREAGAPLRPLWWLLLGAGLAVCVWAGAQSDWAAWRMLLILVLLGTALYAAARLRRRV